MVEIEFMHPHVLRGIWPYVRRKLFALCSKRPQDWIPEDVFHACMQMTATLHAIKEAGQVTGFFVVEETQEFGCKSLHVWLMVHEGVGDQNLYTAVLERLKGMARQGRCHRVRFSTQRTGWARKLKQMGWKESIHYLEMPV